MEACGLAAACISAGIAVAKAVGEIRGVTLAIVPKPKRVVKKEPESLKGYDTLEEPFNKVRKLLLAKEKNEAHSKNKNVIQICGMIGTGKTTIMANLNDDDELGREYDIIIWLDVSSDDPENFRKMKNIGYEQLRKDVMRRLNISDRTVGSDEEKIKKFLKNKKYLLLLDNVKANLDLYKIGFPRNWERKGSKVVLTTRWKGSHLSIVDRVVEVKQLDWDGSKKMFFDISGCDRTTTKFHQLIERCGGLPIVIKIVAGRFRTAEFDDELLKLTINALKTCPEPGGDIVKNIRGTLGFCCEDLNDEEKLCFYYGALYPEGRKIHKDRLLDCWIAEEIKVRNRANGRLLLRHFEDRNLFEKDGSMFIKMHALIRLLALHNLQTDGKRKFLVGSKHVSSDQNDDSWKEKHWISLANCYGGPFPDSPDCSELSTLFLQENSKLNKLPDLFFTNMGSLRVLDLTGTSIESLPRTLKDSKKLAVLYLNKCTKLSDQPSVIGNLENLKVLDITGCDLITQVTQIVKLKNLKRFLVSSRAFNETSNISRVISELPKLNELLIDTESEKKTFDWKIIKKIIKRIMDNVKTLENITSLQFQFLNDEIVVVWERVDDERKFFGHSISQGAEMRMLFQSYFDKWIGREPSSAAVKLFSMSDAVEIIAGQNNLKQLDASIFSNSAAILVENCPKITYILGPSSAPSSLEQLYLNDMEKLKSVTHGLFHLSNFGKLKILKLYNCPQLTNIITIDAMKDAEEDMPECSTSAVQKKALAFPELEELVLVDLPNLVSIWKNELLEFPSLIEVEIRNCPALKYLPISRNNTQKPKFIKTTRTWWGALHWEDPAAQTYFQDIVHYEMTNGAEIIGGARRQRFPCCVSYCLN